MTTAPTDSSLNLYLPVDRYHSLLEDRPLPALAEGAVLFADISGFTPLTEKLVAELGENRGAEELSHLLNLVYTALIEQVELYHGSVIYFSGDAITCWWAAGESGLTEASRAATSAAFALQTVIGEVGRLNLAKLALKVSLAAGPVRRFVVGQPEIQLLDVLAGEPLERLALAESVALEGEIVAAPEIWQSLQDSLVMKEWRASVEGAPVFGILASLTQPAPTNPWPPLAGSPGNLRQWVLPEVTQRLESGLGSFLTELRPAVAMFMGFDGLDYSQDDAEAHLNRLVGRVQAQLQLYEGSLIQLTTGDKGTYIYAAFGALVAHKNDAEQAVRTALALLAESEPAVQLRIGISQGTMRTGTYGGRTRATYGVLGDEVNLAARLMQAAAPNQLLISERVRKRLGDHFKFGELPPLKVKGKLKPLTVYQCAAAESVALKSTAILTNTYRQPLLGRQAELDLIHRKLREVGESGQGQMLEISGGAGIGKSRLLAEAVRLAEAIPGWRIFIGQGQSFGTRITYLAWQNLFREIFDLEADQPIRQQIGRVALALNRLNPTLARRLPLLGPLLGLPVEDNEFSRNLDPAVRKSALEELVVELLQAMSRQGPILLILEDCHWLDPLSNDLLEALGRAARLQLPLLILTSTRPAESEEAATSPGKELVRLGELSLPEARRLLSTKLEERLGLAAEQTQTVVERLANRAEGNPFYLEELVNWLCDHFDGRSDLAKLLDQLEALWPESLHSLVLSRLDRLSESEKAILKVASVIGRTFQPAWVWGIYPGVGEAGRVLEDLQHLERLDITPLDPARPELAYTFKHMVTHEVAYQSLTHAQKEELHQAAGLYIEQQETGRLPLDLLAYHYGRSANRGKQRQYLALAGQQAQANYATASALAYYRQLRDLLETETAEPEKVRTEWLETTYQLSRVLTLVGNWPEAEAGCRQALERVADSKEQPTRFKLQLAGVLIMQGRYPEATQEIEGVIRAEPQPADLAGAYSRLGWIALMQADYELAQQQLEKSRDLFRELGDRNNLASVYKNLSTLETSRGNGPQARLYAEQALELSRAANDRQGIATALDVLGTLLVDYNGDLAQARVYNEEALSLNREMGNRRGMAYNLNNLGVVADRLGDYEQARHYYEAQLGLRRELNDTRGLILALYNVGVIAVNYLHRPDLARGYFQEGLACGEAVNDRLGRAISHGGLGCVAFLEKNYAEALAGWKESLAICGKIKARSYALALLTLIAALETATGRPEQAAVLCGCVDTQVARLKVSLDTLLDTADYKVYDETILNLKTTLDPAEFETAFARGTTLSLEEAVELVLA